MSTGRPRRILVVDDSAVMRSVLRGVISAIPGYEVAGTAGDGETALTAIERLNPDAVLLDVEMPKMDGLATLRALRARRRTLPVLMCSALTQRGARVTIEALAAGASDYVTKPAEQGGREASLAALTRELVPKIRTLTSARAAEVDELRRRPSELMEGGRRAQRATRVSAIVIGVSTGGPAALEVLLSALPKSFPAPVLVVQHMPEVFTAHLAEYLDSRCRIDVREAANRQPVCAGRVYVARGNWHMEVSDDGQLPGEPLLRLRQGQEISHCRPSVDVLFESAAAVYGESLLAVVLTGMGSDGLAGAREVRRHGGHVLVQNQASSAVWGMPGAVSRAGLAHAQLSLEEMAAEFVRLTSSALPEAKQVSEAAV